jgi:Fanconi anemia group D2 protein
MSSDSLVKVLLRIGLEAVQPALVACLFAKIPEYFDGDDNDGRLADSIPRLVLAQFKFLEVNMPESKVTSQLLDLIDVAPIHIKREAIAIIPDVAVDEEHTEVVDRLRSQLDGDPLCTNAVLDAFSNLTLDDMLLADVADKVMDLVRSAQPSDLPVVVRYLVQSCSGSSALARKTVCALRENLNFFSSEHEDAVKDCDKGQTLTIEALFGGLKFRKHLVAALLEEIRAVDNVDAHRPFDIWALLILRQISDTKRQAEVDRLFKKKVTGRLFAPGFMRDSIAKMSHALRPYFWQICAVADSLMKAHDDGLAAFGTEVYQVLFEVYRDDSSRQDILGNIISHSGAGDDSTVDSALNVLVHLAHEHRAELRPFAVFIKGILDYLDNLKPHQIRKLFNVLSMISISDGAGARELDDDVTIYIRKLLSSAKWKYMQHGIIGAVSAIVALSTVHCHDSPTSQGADSAHESQLPAGSRGRYDQAMQLLETVKSKCDVTQRAGVYFYDELSNGLLAVRAHSDRRIKASSLEWMMENLASTLEDTYLYDLPESETGDEKDRILMPEFCEKSLTDLHPSLKLRGMYNLDGAAAQVLLNPVKLMTGAEQNEMLHRMCAVFRLVGTIEWATKGCIDDIDALAGCPILMFDDEHIQDFKLLEPGEKSQIVLLSFHASNWIIEVLNTFCNQPDAEIKTKMVQRVNNLMQILSTLDEVLQMHGVQLPDLNEGPDLDCGYSGFKQGPRTGKGKGRGEESAAGSEKGKGKAKGNGKEPASDDSDDSMTNASDPTAKVKKGRRTKGKGKEAVDDDEDGTGEHGATATQKGAAGGTANGQKTNLQLACTTGIFTQLTSVRGQASSFRQLDITVQNVLAYSFESSADNETTLTGLDDCAVLGLLQDLLSKVDAIVAQRRLFPWGNRASAPSTSRRQLDPLGFFSKMQAIWPSLRHLFYSCAKRLGATDETMDLDMESAPDSQLQEILLTFIAIIERSLDCSEYLGPNRLKHQMALLSTLNIEGGQGSTEHAPEATPDLDVQAAAVGAFRFFDAFVQQMPTFRLASALIFLLAKITDKACGEDGLQESLSDQALWCLTSSAWGDSTVKERDSLSRLLACYISRSKEPIECINKISMELLPAFDPDDVKDDVEAEGYCKMSGRSFSSLFNVVFDHTMQSFAEVEKTVVEMNKRSAAPEGLLVRLHASVQAFNQLIRFSNNWDRDSGVLHACVKYGNKIVVSFTKVVPYLERSFKTQPEEIKAIVRGLQLSTRALQHICAHGKVEKDQRVFQLVPQVRRNLETMLFKVKALIENIGCLAAFSVGNLKHRNLQGHEVCSQVAESDDDDDDEESEQEEEAATPGQSEDSEQEGQAGAASHLRGGRLLQQPDSDTDSDASD